MQIKFTNYKNGLHQFDFKTSVGELGLEEKFNGNVLLNCEMDKSSTQIVLKCNLQLTAKYICDRCTLEFEDKITTKFKSIYFITYSKKNDEVDENGIYYLSPDDDKIDLSIDTVGNALLAIPMKILCNEDCKGLCSMCGINQNENECNCVADTSNPIWDKLLELKGKLN
jgi:uncharacterized protein